MLFFGFRYGFRYGCMVGDMVGGPRGIQLHNSYSSNSLLAKNVILGSAITMAMVLHSLKFLRSRFFTLYIDLGVYSPHTVDQ